MLKFPKNFYWGAADSAEETEGKQNSIKGNTFWDILYKENPDQFFDKVGNSIVNDTINRYKEDLDLFSNELNFNSFRTSISWARLFPDGKTLNKEAVLYYNKYFDYAKSKNIELFVCLSHFDFPEWIYTKLGGLESKNWIEYFLNYAIFVFNEFGSKIKYFSTFNEPFVSIWAAYQAKFHYPQIIDKNKAMQVAYNLTLAHSKVLNYFKTNIKNKFNNYLGIINCISPSIPKDGKNFTAADKKAATKADTINNYALLDAMAIGIIGDDILKIIKELDINLDTNSDELELIKSNWVDFIGINYYKPFRVQAIRDRSKIDPAVITMNYYEDFQWEGAIMNVHRGWEIRAKSLYDICKVMEKRYKGIPFYIAENGMGVENEERFLESNVINDQYRIDFLKQHLYWLHKAIKELDIKCFGYHMWTGVDCWSWLNAYKNRYGFVSLDLKTQKRTIKKSGFWYKNVIKNNGFKMDIKILE